MIIKEPYYNQQITEPQLKTEIKTQKTQNQAQTRNFGFHENFDIFRMPPLRSLDRMQLIKEKFELKNANR